MSNRIESTSNEPHGRSPSSIRRAAPAACILPLLLLAACATGGGASPEAAPAPAAPAVPETADASAPRPAAVEEASAADPAPAAADAAPADAEPAASSPAAAYLDDPAAITAGRRMFRAVCTGYCHSTTPGVTKDAPNLFDCDWDHGNRDADLYRVIAQGVPDTEMLPFDGKIPDDTIWKVIAYMRSNAADCG